ncbi:MAG: Hpt domain-containing protein, partial [Acetobacteraceae bacterium]
MLTVSLDSLAWIKPEIERSLEAARRRLDAYSEERDKPELFDEFAENLHQATGSFSMLELPGGRELAEQMEALAAAVRDGRLTGDLENFELLMRGCLELSDYLDGLLSGVPDPAAVLLPVTNEIRIRLGQGPVVRERAGRARPRLVPTPSGEEDMASLAARLRPDYQAALLDFYRDRDKAGAVAGMMEIVARLESTATDPAIFELLWILGGLLEALTDGGLAASRSIKQTLGQFERELKRLAAGSAEAAEEAGPDALADRMLAEIEQSTIAGERVSAIRAVFQLENGGETWVAHAAVPGSSLLASAGGAVLEDLGRVRDRIDIFVRTGSSDVGGLAPLDGMLKKVSDALSMLGLETARVHVEEQREAIRRLVASEEGATTDLLGVATGLVGVEGDVEAYLAGRDETSATLVERNARMAGLREALADISRLKEAFSEYVRSRAPSRLELLPGLVDTLAGTLDFLAMGDAAALMRRIGDYITGLAAGARVPGRAQLD